MTATVAHCMGYLPSEVNTAPTALQSHIRGPGFKKNSHV
jgi:hypothetical protein